MVLNFGTVDVDDLGATPGEGHGASPLPDIPDASTPTSAAAANVGPAEEEAKAAAPQSFFHPAINSTNQDQPSVGTGAEDTAAQQIYPGRHGAATKGGNAAAENQQ